ncbi:MAG TPA: PRC-barrel domain-containing protein [Baekduia sp.]|nr:PRC-barrel domain-containing protein [Baekduia sp.]
MNESLLHFRSELAAQAHELRGMSVEASDGSLGKVINVVEGEDGAFLVVDTGPWILGRELMLPAGIVSAIDRAADTVLIDRPKDELKDAPQGTAGEGGLEALLSYFGSPASAEAAPAGEPAAFQPRQPEPFAPPVSTSAFPEPPAAERVETPEPEPEPSATARPEPAPFVQATPEAGPFAKAAPESEPVAGAPPEPEPIAEEPPKPEPFEQPERVAAAQPEPEPFVKPEPEPVAEAMPEPEPEAEAAPEPEPEPEPEPAPRRTTASQPKKRGGTAGGPIPGYESLTAAELQAKLRTLPQAELTKVERFERRHDNRRTVLERIESLRGEEPWRGYDRQNVGEIADRLAKVDEDRARFVRDYERRHKGRNGVVEAARRRLAAK